MGKRGAQKEEDGNDKNRSKMGRGKRGRGVF
jgi:hypothetical protein